MRPKSGPIGYWRLREAPGGVSAADASGNANDGRCSGTIAFGQPGFHGGDTAALFDGATGRIVVLNSNSLNPPHITMEAKIRWDGPNDLYQRILEKSSFAELAQYGFGVLPNGRVRVELRTSSATTSVNVDSTAAVSQGVEMHIVATYDGNVIRIYLNGVLDSETHAPGSVSPKPPTPANLVVVLQYHDDMTVPYTSTGRTRQKERTRDALIAATRELLARGLSPRVEDAAAHAGISRTTAYRYYPNQRALLLAAHPEIELHSLLPHDPPTDLHARLDLTVRAFIRLTIEWEPQLRTQLRLSLEPGAEQPALRQGRAIDWIHDALTPLRQIHPTLDSRRLAIAIRSATGIESLIWLTDIAHISHAEATEIMCQSAHAILLAAHHTG